MARRRTFSSTTGTALARLRRPEKFQAVLEDMLSGAQAPAGRWPGGSV